MRQSLFWTRWILRDNRSRWIQIISIALVIGLGTGTYSGLSSTTSWRLKSNDMSFAITNMHDIKVSLNTGSYVPEKTLETALQPLTGSGLVSDIEERLTVTTQLRTRGKKGVVMATGRLVGMDFSNNGPHIDTLHFTEGKWRVSSITEQSPAVVDHTFASFNDLRESATLELPGGTKLQVVGKALSPEYFIADDDSGLGLNQGSHATIFVPIQTAQKQSGLGHMINSAVLVVEEGRNIEYLREAVAGMIEQSLPNYGFSVSTKYEDPVYRMLYESADADQQFYHIIGLAILTVAVFAAFNLTSRILQAQRREIGIGMAMGVPVVKLALRPLLTGIQISLLGVILGAGLGLLLNSIMRDVFESTLPLPIWVTPFQIQYFVWVALVGFFTPVAAIAIPILMGLRVRPIEAIRAGHLAPVRTGLAPVISKVPLPGNTFCQIPFRNLLRVPKRTMLTVLAISVIIAVMISVLGMVDSIVATIDKATNESLGEGVTRLEITLDKLTPINSSVITSIESNSYVEVSQPVLRFGAKLFKESREQNLFITAIDPNDAMWLPSISQGHLPGGPNQIMLAETTAAGIGVETGDTIIVEYPIMTGATSVVFVKDTFMVSGLHPHPIKSYAYVHTAQASTMGMIGIAESIWIEPTVNASVDDVKESLFAIQGVSSVFESSAIAKATADSIEDQVGILQVVRFVVLGLALLIAFNTASINMDDRAREHATMMAFGLPVPKIMRMAVLESTTIGLLASMLGMGLGLLLLNYFVRVVFATVIPEIGLTTSVSLGTFVISMVLGIIFVGLAPLLTTRKLLKTNIPSTLRVLE